MKNIVLDTNIILQDASSIFKFGDNHVIIPSIILEELDKKKRQMDEVGKNARLFSRLYMDLRREHKNLLSEGAPLETGGTIRVELSHKRNKDVEIEFSEPSNDNKILAVVANLCVASPKEHFLLVTNDTLMIAKADTIKKAMNLANLDADVYENDRLIESPDYIHQGNHELEVPDEIIDQLYKNPQTDYAVIEPFIKKGQIVCINDFFHLKKSSNSSGSFVGRMFLDPKDNKRKIRKLWKQASDPVKGITPKNVQQKMYMELLLDPSVKLVSAIGKAGSGKTLLALAAGLFQTEGQGCPYKKMLIGRPIIPMGKDIGYLPGEKEEKIRPWMQSIYDNLEFIFDVANKKGKDDVDYMVSQMKNLQIEALTYIRGRSIPQQLIFIDEAQNLTPHEVKTIITRAGEGSKIVLMGDPDQIDHPYLDAINNGLTFATERMKHIKESGVICLKKSERSELAEKATILLK